MNSAQSGLCVGVNRERKNLSGYRLKSPDQELGEGLERPGLLPVLSQVQKARGQKQHSIFPIALLSSPAAYLRGNTQIILLFRMSAKRPESTKVHQGATVEQRAV